MAVEFFKTVSLVRLLLLQLLISCHGVAESGAAAAADDFIFSGFSDANLTLDGTASITPDGLLQLTDATNRAKAHAFYPYPLRFKSTTTASRINSFSTTFVFAIVPEQQDLSGHGIAFLLSPSRNFSAALPAEYLGLFNMNSNGNASNHVIAIELDTVQSSEFEDIDENHVGVDINSLLSNASHHAGYYTNTPVGFQNLSLTSGEPMQVWIDYNGKSLALKVTLGPMNSPKPEFPLLSLKVNLSTIILDEMFIGFSSSTGLTTSCHYVLGWSFKMNGVFQALEFWNLPNLPKIGNMGSSRLKLSTTLLPIMAAALLVLLAGAMITLIVRQRKKFAELLEDWELEYGPQRFKYRDLFEATKGFKEKELLGTGGFGRVYKGVLPDSKLDVAVKKVSHESRQGMREFIAEIVSIGRLRHRNLVQLLGYCRRKEELLLVYDYMPNGSLDKFLYDLTKPALGWAQRFGIIKGVASGLLYLHEYWEQVVIHRDVKASNVLLDAEMNGRLGDFGLSRLYDRGSDPQTTHIVGTMGYLAPELAGTGKATPLTDVYAFGAFTLEVACGRRPIDPSVHGEERVLADWVLKNLRKGTLLQVRDSRLGDDYVEGELELVLKVGLICSHPFASERPSTRQVLQYLEGNIPVPELSPAFSSFSIQALLQTDGFEDYAMSFPSSEIATTSLASGR